MSYSKYSGSDKQSSRELDEKGKFFSFSSVKTLPKKKGFAFVLEVLIAILLVVSFLQLNSLSTQKNTDFAQMLEEKQRLGNALSFIDQNGFFLQIMDNNSLPDSVKMDSIFGALSSLLPEKNLRIEIRAFNADANKCKANPTFSSCFSDLNVFSPRGTQVPLDKDVSHEKLFVIKKESSKQCYFGAAFSRSNDTLPLIQRQKNIAPLLRKLSFDGEAPDSWIREISSKSKKYTKLLFSGGDRNDLNIFFGVSVNPPTDAECGQTIHVDLNASISAPGRFPANVMLVQDKSGSMSWDGLLDLTDSRDVFGTPKRKHSCGEGLFP